MNLVDLSQYDRVRPLFEGLRHNLVVDSVLDGHTPGWVYADDVEAPRTAWVWNRMDAMLVAGDAADNEAATALSAVIRDLAVPDARLRGIDELSLFYDGAEWEAQARAIVCPWKPEMAWRRVHRFDRPSVDWRNSVPPGAQILPIDEGLLGDERLENVRAVQGWVLSFWPSYADFVATGFGYALEVGERIASWCLTVYASGDRRELGLATVPEQRGHGFATLAAAATVDHAVSHGITPEWHCWDDNLPSIRVAEKVGFVDPDGYSVWRVRI